MNSVRIQPDPEFVCGLYLIGVETNYSGFHNGRPQAIETGSARGHDPYITDVFSHFLSQLAFGVNIFESGCNCGLRGLRGLRGQGGELMVSR